MNKLLISAFCTALALGVRASDVSAAIGVMATDNADFGWQANVPDNGVIDWRWENATKATVTVVSALTRKTVISKEVSKDGDEKYGSVTLPEASATEDQLFDLTVALDGGETLTARVARPAKVKTLLSEKPQSAWRRVKAPEVKMTAYDAAWFDGCADATTAACTIDGHTFPLPAPRGFSPVAPWQVSKAGPFDFALAFDSVTEFSDTLWLLSGFSIIFR